MKKVITLISLLFATTLAIAETTTNIKLLSSSNGVTTIQFTPGSLLFKNVSTPLGKAQIISLDKGAPMLIAGAPDLQKLTTSMIIPDLAAMKISIVSSNYYELSGIDIAPSKGNLKRNIEPGDIAYTYGAIYDQNSFYPSSIANLNTPYILRDFRAQTISVCPFQYNPVTKTVRVYTEIVIAVSEISKTGGENPFERLTSEKIADKEFEAIYKRQFINYSLEENKSAMYTQAIENGSMLVICYDAFAPDMQPFINWKNRKGIATEMVLKSAVGTTSASIKTFISTYYSLHPNLKYVLLVGDAAQIPSSTTSAGDSDNNYAYITGNDSYPELFIGRFSATTNAHVQIQVKRTLDYEETPQAGAVWYKKGIAIASDQGPGDDNEMDFEHQRNLNSQLLAYTYATVSENFDGSQGGIDATGDPSAASIGTQLNNGAGIITYTGHGSDFAFSTSGYSTTNISSLTNTTAHPFVWSVACVNGNFVANATCFAEGWLRAGTPAAPTGALATLMSTINQSWNPPMEGQDAMVAILVESDSTNIKRTFGGLSFNGCMQMNDVYGSAGNEMTDTWTLFGDPSVMVFTDSPAPMVTSHISAVNTGTTSVIVTNNTDDALICLSQGGIIKGTGIAMAGSVIINIPAAVSGIIDVTATAFNKMPYNGTISVGSVGVDENNVANSFVAFPNPAHNSLTVSCTLNTTSNVRLLIYNTLGQAVITNKNRRVAAGSFTNNIDLSELPAGIYSCKFETETSVFVRQIVIHK